MTIGEELYTLLCDVALVAARHGYVTDADQIFECLIELHPQDDRARLAQAISRIYLERAHEAVTLLQEGILTQDPKHPYARGFLGFAFKMAGFSDEGNRELRNLIAEGEHPTVVTFALSLLQDPAFDQITPASHPIEFTPPSPSFTSNMPMSPIMFC